MSATVSSAARFAGSAPASGLDLFTTEHEELRRSVRAFVERGLAPHAEEWERN
ncbi:MAG: acyl-CoA dehydrogenase family protein, partial [Actinomycetota bacterium]